MLDALIDLIENLDALELATPQQEAVVELLAIMMFADGYDSSVEHDYLATIEAKSKLDGARLTELTVALGAEIRSRHLKGGDLADLIDGAIDRIGSKEALKKVYLLCDRMANSDRMVKDSEKAVLDRIIERTQ